MKGYVARDKDGNAFLFKNKPYKDFIAWKEDSDEFILFMDNNNLPSDINPQWEDEEPIEVEINITKVSDVVTVPKDRYEQLLQYEQEYISRQQIINSFMQNK